MTKLLRVVAPHFVAGAVFENKDGVWRCTRVAPIIKYIAKMKPKDIKAYFEKKGWEYAWVEDKETPLE